MRLCLAALAACYGSPAHPSAPAGPACSPTVKIDLHDDGTTTAQALLDGKDLGLAVDHEDGKSDGAATVFPYSTHSVLFSWTAHGHYGRPNGGSTLYEVDCAAKAATPFYAGGNADFGNAVMTRDGRTIYFSAIGGVQALDVPTKKTRQVTPRVELTSCGDRPDNVDEQGNPIPRIALSAVIKLDEDEDQLVYQDGDNCGFEGDWDGTTLYLDHPAHPGKPYAPRPVRAVAADPGGVWASTGGCGEVALWRSTDRGDHWKRVVVPGEGDGGPAIILADTRHAGFAMIELVQCVGPGVPVISRLLETRDAGATWTPLELPWGDSAFADNTVALEGGSLDHPIAWAPDREMTEKILAWRWAKGDGPDDTAEAWQPIDQPPARPSEQSTRARLHDDIFDVSPNGLLRHRGTDKPVRLFPN